MANRNLNDKQLGKARELLADIRTRLKKLSRGDGELMFAYRRKITKELSYDERSRPLVRRKLKKLKFEQQKGRCALCRKKLPEKYAVLDRRRAVDGYTDKNTRLIHDKCDVRQQQRKKYK